MVRARGAKTTDYLLPAAFCLLLSACCLTPAAFCLTPPDASPLTCRISEISSRSRSLSVSCSCSTLAAGKWQLHFTDEFAGINRLSERVYGLKARDAGGAV